MGVPHGLKEIYRGVDLKHAVPYGKDKLLIESKSYMSFSRSKQVASGFPKQTNKIHGIYLFYNKLWGMKSTISEEEVVLLPGTLIISKTPFVLFSCFS